MSRSKYQQDNEQRESLPELICDPLQTAPLHQFQGQGVVQLQTPQQPPVKLKRGHDGSLS